MPSSLPKFLLMNVVAPGIAHIDTFRSLGDWSFSSSKFHSNSTFGGKRLDGQNKSRRLLYKQDPKSPGLLSACNAPKFREVDTRTPSKNTTS